MAQWMEMSRRKFVTSAAAVAAISSLPARKVFAGIAGAGAADEASPQRAAALTNNPGWKDQGIENLTKSPHAKLRDIPVHAVTIQSGFWARRREINATNSIPTMHDLLEANGRMNNFRRLAGTTDAADTRPALSASAFYTAT